MGANNHPRWLERKRSGVAGKVPRGAPRVASEADRERAVSSVTAPTGRRGTEGESVARERRNERACHMLDGSQLWGCESQWPYVNSLSLRQLG